MTQSDHYSLLSVKKAIRLLRAFTVDEPEKGITELAKDLELPKSTVQRLVMTLVDEGFLKKNPETQRYRLGESILGLSGVITSSSELYNEAMPVLRRLVDSVGETSHIAILDGLEVVYLQKVDCHHPVRLITHLGSRNPLHCTSSGKAILAHKEKQLFDQVVKNGLKPYTRNTITDPNQLMMELEKVRRQGYASDVNEVDEGTVSVAAPVRDYTGEVVAAINIVGPIQRFAPYKIPQFAAKVMQAAQEVSRQLGYYR
jgi:DNA-binding IclR family transcriptional regulator